MSVTLDQFIDFLEEINSVSVLDEPTFNNGIQHSTEFFSYVYGGNCNCVVQFKDDGTVNEWYDTFYPDVISDPGNIHFADITEWIQNGQDDIITSESD